LKQVLSPDSQAVLVKQNLAEALQMVVIATAIDEFEQTIYHGNYLPTEYESVMAEVHASYDMEDIYSLTYMQLYWKMVVVSSAVYYISYATSQIASINLYVVAEQYGYDYAQEVYRKLQEEGSSEQGFVEVILNSGLPNPFLEQTYIDIVEVFSNLE
jgi:oligoendopeptidase F